jgi:hypothetical protein
MDGGTIDLPFVQGVVACGSPGIGFIGFDSGARFRCELFMLYFVSSDLKDFFLCDSGSVVNWSSK